MRRKWAWGAGWLRTGLVVAGLLGLLGSGLAAQAQTTPRKAALKAQAAAQTSKAQAPAKPAAASPVNSQVQVSRQFLRALLRGDYAAAYRQLAPEVRRDVGATQFRQLARPVAAQGQRRGAGIELYKMGMRLDEAGAGSEPFVAFAWAADSASAQRTPREWLEVTFRNAEARQVLGFRLRRR